MIWDWFLLTPFVCSIMNLILCSFPGKYSIFFFESIAVAQVIQNKWLIYNTFRTYLEACPALHELIQCCCKKIKKAAQMMSIESKGYLLLYYLLSEILLFLVIVNFLYFGSCQNTVVINSQVVDGHSARAH